MEPQERIEEMEERADGGSAPMILMVGLIGLGVLLVKTEAVNALFYWLHCVMAS